MNTLLHHPDDKATRWLALGAIVGPVLFTLAWIVLGLLRPDYAPISRPISALGVGPNGIFMDAAFVLNGVLCLIGVIAIFHSLKGELRTIPGWFCTALLALSPLGILWDGIFTMNNLALHNIGVQLAVTSLIIVYVIVGLFLRRVARLRRFGTWMLLGSPLTLALLVGFTISVPHAALISGLGGGSYGLWERGLVIEGQAWYVILGWLAFRRP